MYIWGWVFSIFCIHLWSTEYDSLDIEKGREGVGGCTAAAKTAVLIQIWVLIILIINNNKYNNYNFNSTNNLYFVLLFWKVRLDGREAEGDEMSLRLMFLGELTSIHLFFNVSRWTFCTWGGKSFTLKQYECFINVLLSLGMTFSLFPGKRQHCSTVMSAVEVWYPCIRAVTIVCWAG